MPSPHPAEPVSHYDTLEVSRHASAEVIRAAYRSLMQRDHPDKHGGDAALTQRVARVAEAYEVLSDPARRAEYDRWLAQQPASAAGASAAQAEMFGYSGMSSVASPSEVARAVHTAPLRRGDGAAPNALDRHRHRDQPGSIWRSPLWTLLLVAAAVVASVLAYRAVRGIGGVGDVAGAPAADARMADLRRELSSEAVSEARKRELWALKEQLVQQSPEQQRAEQEARIASLKARTVDLLQQPIKVRIGAARVPSGAVLQVSIPQISVRVGTFDAPAALAHIARHHDSLIQDLIANFETADALPFIAAESVRQPTSGNALDAAAPASAEVLPQDLSRYRAFIVDSLVKSLDQDPTQTYPSTYHESPGRYGVVEVGLPAGVQVIQGTP